MLSHRFIIFEWNENTFSVTTQSVLLLTFSNDADDYLPMIVAEQKAIKKALLNFVDKNFLEVRDVQHASTEEIFYLVNRYHQRLHIFHYGGHAGRDSLQLEQQVGVVQAANVRGIAGLLGTQEQLKLVFLNGCATRGQVKTLLDSGVPAVIATRVAIRDREAQQFGTQFYEALANGSTIREAYLKAKAFIETARKDLPIGEVESSRGIVLTSDDPQQDIPWGLYFREDKAEALDWKLPTSSPLEIDFSSDRWENRWDSPVNELLVDSSLKAIRESEVVKDLARKIHTERKSGNPGRKPTDAEKKDAIVRAFPAPVSVHLRALFSKKLSEKYDENRLQQLVNTYRITLKLIAYIGLSDLWDVLYRSDRELDISGPEKLQLRAFFDLNAFTVATFDYFLLVDALLKVANRNGVKLYVDALGRYAGGWTDQPALLEIWEHFQRMSAALETNLPDRQLETFGRASEEKLTGLLEEMYFLIHYKMAVVKNIEVQQLKNLPPVAYRHVLVELDNNYQDIGDKDRQQELDEPTDMESVLFYQTDLRHSLNLSPFILDENALIREFNSKMYLYSHTTAEGLHYYWVENESDTLLVTDRRFPQVKRQFERAREVILGERVKGKIITDADNDDILSVI